MNPNRYFKFIFIAILSLIFLPCFSFGQDKGESILDRFVQEALENNPQIQQVYQKWKAEQYKTQSISALDDPMVGYTYFGEEVQTRVGPQEQKFNVSQKIPFPGKLSLKGKAQAAQAKMLEQEYEKARRAIIAQVKATYYDLFWVDKSIEINEEEKSILEDLEGSAQKKYESNLGTQQNILKIQVELSKILQKIFLLKQNRESLSVKLNTLINNPSGGEINKVLSLKNISFSYNLDELLGYAKETRQDLIEADFLFEKAQKEKTLSKMAYLPNFTIGAEYIEIGSGTTTSMDDGQDAWAAMVSVNVPIWFWKLDAQVKEKEAQLKSAQKNKEQVENQAELEVKDAYFKIIAYKDVVLLYETALLPQAKQAFDGSQTGFETSGISFIDWLDAERTYLQTRLAYYKSIVDYRKAIAYLEQMVGRDL
ncbi:MAG: TolC family protein [Candidatus Aceula meridiana]|nr:TolC family protein [Candidatus Aceula meridiana]